MKKAIFTCLFGEYDNLNPAPSFTGWDCFLFTDKKPDDAKEWTVLIQSPWPDLRKQSRHYKILSHRFLPDYDLVCYLDANMVLLKEPPSRPIWGKHYSGRNLMQEARQILNLQKEDKTIIDRQMIFYSRHRIRQYPSLMQNGFFVREHSARINSLHEAWWEQVNEFSYRDQLSLPFVMAKMDIHVQGISAHSEVSKYFKIVRNHIPQQRKKNPSVHHITAGRADKNIGKAINDIIKGLPDGDWICYRDIDTIPMSHETFFKQCEEIAQRGDFTLVGCMTNRLGLERQLYGGRISDNPDILYHRKIAKELFEQYGSEVKRVNGGIAGLMMLFPKDLWIEVGGFDEGGIVSINGNYFDYNFSMKAKAKKAKIGVADGIYLFHFYRFEAENPKISTKHLY
jgi:hypothetical protein